MSFFNFGPPASLDVEITPAGGSSSSQGNFITIPAAEIAGAKEDKVMPLFQSGETIAGTVKVNVKSGKKVEHVGVRCELVGQIELFYDRGNHYEFLSLVRELEADGELTESKELAFEFSNVEKQYESYNGINVRLRYFVRCTILRQYSSNIETEVDFWVQNRDEPPEHNSSLKMEVGIEDCLHLEFEYDRSKYHLKDVIVGKIYFLLVRIKIKHMEISLIRRESTGSGPNLYNESETVTKFEIMDGAPVRGESIPIRLFLSGFELTPTYRSVHNKFSVKYYLNLVLVDRDDRRYFKQQEITLWRKDIQGEAKPVFVEKGYDAEDKAREEKRKQEIARKKAEQAAREAEEEEEETDEDDDEYETDEESEEEN